MLDTWNNLDAFKEYIRLLDLQHFNYYEILTGVFKEREGIVNAPPPVEIWHNIGPSLLVIDELRKTLDVPITINSTYRSPEYNPLLGGARKSQHMGFVAIDINARGVSPTAVADQLIAWQTEGKWIQSPVKLTPVDVEVPAGVIPRENLKTREVNGQWEFRYKGGVGYYSSFTHMDTRGVTVKWDNRRHDSLNEQRSRSLTAESVILD